MVLTFETGGDTYEIRITPAVLRQGEGVYRRAYQQAVSAGAMPRKRAMDLADRLWTTEKHAKYSALLDAIRSDEELLQSGQLSLTEGLVVAVRVREARAEAQSLRAEVDAVVGGSAEGRALQAQFEYVVVSCTFKNGTRAYPDRDALQQGGSAAEEAQSVVGGALCNIRGDYEPSRHASHTHAA